MADHPNETSFGHSAAPQLALLHHQVSDSLVLAPSTCVSGCLGVYPARDFKKGDIACAIESATGAWVETASLALAEEGRRFNLVLKCPNPRNVLHGRAWELVFQGDAKRFVWPHLNSSANYEGIHGLHANVKLQVTGTELGNRFLHVEFLEDCTAFSRELLLDYEVTDDRPQTTQLAASPSKKPGMNSPAPADSLAASSSLQANSPAPVTSSPQQPAPQLSQNGQQLLPAKVNPESTAASSTVVAEAKEEATQGLCADQPQKVLPAPAQNDSMVEDLTNNGKCLCKFDRPPGSALYWYQEEAWLTFAKPTNAFPATLVYTVLGGSVAAATDPEHLLTYDISHKTYVW